MKFALTTNTMAVTNRSALAMRRARSMLFQIIWPSPGKRGGLNGSTQHFPEVYSQAFESLMFFLDADLRATLLCPDRTESSRSGLFSSGSIVVIVRLCFRLSRVARDSADHRSRLSHPSPP